MFFETLKVITVFFRVSALIAAVLESLEGIARFSVSLKDIAGFFETLKVIAVFFRVSASWQVSLSPLR